MVRFAIDELTRVGTDPFGNDIVEVSAHHKWETIDNLAWYSDHIKPGFQIALCHFDSGNPTIYSAENELFRLHVFVLDYYPIMTHQDNVVETEPDYDDILTTEWEFIAVMRPGSLMKGKS